MKTDYLVAAINLHERAKRRLKCSENPMQQEIEDLFYWILRQLEWTLNMKKDFSPKEIVLSLEKRYSKGKEVTLCHEAVEEYSSRYVQKEEFYTVMEKVAEIFNGMEGKFSAVCNVPETKWDESTAQLIVVMTVE